VSGATGAGGATGGLPGAGGGTPSYGVPPRPTEHPSASTSLMPPVASAGQSGGGTHGAGFSAQPGGTQGGGFSAQAGGTQGGGFSAQPPAAPPAPPSAPPTSGGGFSQPTTYAKGQPTPARGTRVNAGAQGAGQSTPAPRRPAVPGAAGQSSGRVRKARLRITKADPWSVMKVSFLLSLAVGVIIIVASAVLWMTLDGLGVFDSLSSTMSDVTGNGEANSNAFDLMDYIGFGKVMMFTTLIAVVDVVLMTALATLAAFIYNTAAGFTGGIELTLAEED